MYSSEELEFCFFTVTTELLITKTCILNLTTIGLLAVISGFNTVGDVSLPETQVTAETVVNTPEDVELSHPRTLTTKEAVTEYFSDLPILIDVARCESRFNQFDKNGKVIRGEVNRSDVGVMQINEKYHLKESKKLGYDIYTLEGNMAYARYLYEKEGARPWLYSSHCWASYAKITKR